ncbi:MAG: hypothetical protein ABIK09_06120 [Pseudomonadota bacterium]
MNLITRTAAALFGVLCLAGALVAIGLVTGGVSPGRLGFLEEVLAWLHGLPTAGTQAVLWVVLVAGLLLLVGLALVVLQFVGRSEGPLYLLREDERGAFRIRKDAISAIARHVGGEISGIDDVTCAVRQTEAGALVLSCQVLLRPVVDLVAAGHRFQEAVKGAVEEKTGLAVASVDLETGYVRRRASRETRRVVN